MQRLKDNVRSHVLEAARETFLRKGFQKASMRDIAQAAGVGVGNIYHYFTGKDELFCRLVHPAVSALERMLDEHHGRRGVDILAMCDEHYFRRVVDEYLEIIRRHRGPLVLLLFHAQGSSLEYYREDFARRATVLVKDYFLEMKRRHPQLQTDVTDFSLRMHTVWMFAFIEGLIMHRIKAEELEKIVTEYMTIEVAGWRELMKI